MNDARPLVLVVDDERINRIVLAELLQGEYRVLLAGDGPSALQRAREEAAELSLILLDVSMPGMDGYEVLARLKNDDATADIPVIFVTGQSEEADEERGLLLGATDYVPKPIRPAIVRARVRNQVKLASQRRALERLSQLDGLTGVANRRHFDSELDRACRHCQRSGEPLGLAMIDIDHFKQFNDHYGHLHGDETLRRVAQTLAGCVRRPYDLAARYGGEEFSLLVPGGSEIEAMMEQFRRDVMALGILHQGSASAGVVTVSCGVVLAGPQLAARGTDILARADELLYLSKREGRNRVRALVFP